MNKKILIPFITMLVGSPMLALAHEGGGPSAAVRQQIVSQELDQVSQKLGLDAPTSARLKGTFAKYQAQMQPLWKQSFQTRRALKEELANAQPDQGKVGQLTDQLQSLRQQMRNLNEQRQAELKSELSPTQYAQLVLSRRAIGRDLRSKMRAARQANEPVQQ